MLQKQLVFANYTTCRTFTVILNKFLIIMGRGDKKTKKGKIFKGSFGKTRLSRPTKVAKPAEMKKEA